MKKGSAFLKISAFLMVMIMVFTLGACGSRPQEADTAGTENNINGGAVPSAMADASTEEVDKEAVLPENFVRITGGTFEMGSPDTEGWRSEDEIRHTVTVNDFYMSIYEVTQAEYTEVIGNNPSSFSGDDLPVEMVSWMDAVRYCNARSELLFAGQSHNQAGRIPPDHGSRKQLFTKSMGTLQYARQCG